MFSPNASPAADPTPTSNAPTNPGPPVTAKEKPQEGTVIAVGPGRFDDGVRVPMDVKVGDVVLYSKYGGTEIKHGGEDLLVLSALDILAVIEK